MQFDPFPVVRFWAIFFSGVVCDTMNNLKPKNLLLQFVQGKSYIDRTIVTNTAMQLNMLTQVNYMKKMKFFPSKKMKFFPSKKMSLTAVFKYENAIEIIP
jgi:hypothetical protein